MVLRGTQDALPHIQEGSFPPLKRSPDEDGKEEAVVTRYHSASRMVLEFAGNSRGRKWRKTRPACSRYFWNQRAGGFGNALVSALKSPWGGQHT